MREYNHGAVEVSDSAALICSIPQDADKVLVRNVGDFTVYLGGEEVSVENGFPVEPGEHVDVPCFESDTAELYVVAAERKDDEGSALVRFLVSR